MNTLLNGSNLITRVFNTCNKYQLSILTNLCDKQYVRQKINPMYTKEDGIVDSLRYLAIALDKESRAKINDLLSTL